MIIYFNQRTTHRKRQRETVEFCPQEIQALKPDIEFIEDTILSNWNADKKLRFRSILSKLCPINMRIIKDAQYQQTDYIYTWGCVPVTKIRKPYVMEMDNPACICFYNQLWLRLLNPVLRMILGSHRLKTIVCISEACKKSIEVEYGKQISDKVRVVYPYIADKNISTVHKTNKKIEFLFVSTQFLLKGGRETMHAFERLASVRDDFHLTLVTNLNEEQQKQYDLPFVTYVKANLNKKLLHDNYFSKADVFIVPSFQDSFGMVYLEALSYGLPIIATKIFATPEMVYDGENGFLVPSPIHFYKDNYQFNPKYKNGGVVEEIEKHGLYQETAHNLEKCILKIMDDKTREEMRKRSQEIFKDKFSVTIRDKAFLSLFK